MLWIFTQDKQNLINAKEITVDNNNVFGKIGKSFFTEWTKYLGNYDSNERALEVLHEILITIEENNGHFVTFTMPEK